MTAVSLIFDVVVMGLLATTIYYAVRLSKHLDSFRSNRADMERLIRDLSSQITRAQEGITVLDDLSSTKGEELRKYVARAQGMSDELQIMIGSADSLAAKLESLATRNRAIADTMEQSAVGMTFPGQSSKAQDHVPDLKATRPTSSRYEDTLGRAEKAAPKISGPSFNIRDPDYDDQDSDFDDPIDDAFMSQAERDLAEALKRRGQK